MLVNFSKWENFKFTPSRKETQDYWGIKIKKPAKYCPNINYKENWAASWGATKDCIHQRMETKNYYKKWGWTTCPVVDTVFCSSSICLPNPENSKSIIFSLWGHRNIKIDVVQPVLASEYSKCLFKSNWPKCPWLTLGSKLSQNNIFHVSTSNLSYLVILSTLTKFDLRLTLGGTKNSNFYLTIRTS